MEEGIPEDFLTPTREKLTVHPLGALHAHLGRYGLHENSCPIRKHAYLVGETKKATLLGVAR